MSSAEPPKLLVESSEVLPLVDFEIAFSSGSLHDPIGKEGLAQLTGQLMRRGPRGMSTQRFEERLAVLGARMAIDTSMRTTRIRATTLRRSLEPLLALIAELVWSPGMRAGDFAKLKRQSQAALLSRLDDDQTLGAIHFRERLFRGHPYARSSSGTPASLRGISLSDVQRFYVNHFEHGEFVVGMSGAIRKAEAADLVAQHFPKRKRASNGQPRVPATRIARGRHVVIVDKPERTQTQLYIGTLGARTKDVDLFPLVVSNTAFGGTFTGPLMQEVRANRGWSYGAYSRLMHSRRRDAWYMWSAPSAEYSAECAALQLDLARTMGRTRGSTSARSSLPKTISSTAIASRSTLPRSGSSRGSTSSSWVCRSDTSKSTTSWSRTSPASRPTRRRESASRREIY